MIRLSETARDQLFLGFVITLSFLLYIGGLGFYSDDWAFFGASYSSLDRSVLGLFQSLNGPVVWMRPVQVFYFAALYKTFDLNPLGYHVVNHLVFLSGIVCFYAVLQELKQPRLVRFVVPLVFGLLPHYTTDRFWPILFCANLSMTTYFLSVYCDLRMLKASGLGVWSWKLLSILGLLAGTLAYEVFLPLILISSLLVWRHNHGLNSAQQGITKSKLALLLGTNFIALGLVILFKALTTTRVIMQGPAEHILWFANLILNAASVSYVKYGVELPLVVGKILGNHPDWKILTLSLFAFFSLFLYLRHIAKGLDRRQWQGYRMLILAAFGLLVFVFGYVIFVTNENADPTPAGLNNRTAIAAAVGVACSFVGGIGWICGRIRSEKFRVNLFCLSIAILCASGILIINTIANYWVRAYTEQEKILSAIRRQYPTIPSNSTLILDGVCPYVGPAIVFESNWDLAGALQELYRDHNLKADIVRPSMRITEEGLRTTLYEGVNTYPFHRLYIYHYGQKISKELKNAEDARLYFQTYDPYYGIECPESKEGVGVPVF